MRIILNRIEKFHIRMRRLKLREGEVAGELGISVSYFSHLMREHRAMPIGLVQLLDEFLSLKESPLLRVCETNETH